MFVVTRSEVPRSLDVYLKANNGKYVSPLFNGGHVVLTSEQPGDATPPPTAAFRLVPLWQSASDRVALAQRQGHPGSRALTPAATLRYEQRMAKSGKPAAR
jgi:hypothetical protein